MITITSSASALFLSGSFLFLFLAQTHAQTMNDLARSQSARPLQDPRDRKQVVTSNEQKAVDDYYQPIAAVKNQPINNLVLRFNLFTALATNQIYQLTIAADVPNNNHPMKVYHKKETGHVFVILQQIDTVTKKSISQSWGFYPERAIRSLFVRTEKGKIADNSNRQYDACITQTLTEQQFERVKQKAIELTARKYNLNKYNCYDYAVELFNAIPTVEDLPFAKVKFPFVFGRGGSPCGLYSQIKALQQSNSSLKLLVGLFFSPSAVIE